MLHYCPCRRWTLIRAIIPLLAAIVLLGACSRPQAPELSQGTLLPSPKPLLDFALLDHLGRPFTNDSLQQRWSFAFFGYSHCPDVCPTSLSMLGQMQRTLEKDTTLDALPQLLFVSVDPQRDTQQMLGEYVPYFHPSLVGVTGDPQQILGLTRQLGILYAKAEGSGSDDYLVDHSAAIILFDPDGRFHALFSVPHDPTRIAGDFKAIKQYYEAMQ